MAKLLYFGPLFFNIIRLIQLCDKKNLTFVNCCDKIILNTSLKNVKLAKGSLNNILQDLFNIILSQQLTHDRSYVMVIRCAKIEKNKGRDAYVCVPFVTF